MNHPRKTLVLFVAAATMAGLGMTAVTTAQAATAQQQRMKTCNAEAKTKSLAGHARSEFMKSCLSKHGPMASSHNRQQERMKTCNADAKAKGLKGTARRSFMRTCLKG